MERITIRDVTAACAVAGTSGTPALRDSALAIAPRVAPPGSSRARVVEIAAALILLGVGLDPTDHGLSLDAETVARAAAEHEELLRAGEPVETRIARLRHERDAAVEKAAVVLNAAAERTQARLDAEDRADKLGADLDAEHRLRLSVEARNATLAKELEEAHTALDSLRAELAALRASPAEAEVRAVDDAETPAEPARGRRRS